MKHLLLAVLVFLCVLILSMVIIDVARAATTEQAVYDLLREFDSPLADEAFTTVAFRRAQGPDFSIIDFYALLMAESSLGKGTKKNPGYLHHNVASIRGGPVGSMWRDLRTGTFGDGYNHYETFRSGQRAALRLVMERYGGSVLRGDNLRRYYGVGVPGWDHYRANVAAAKRLLIAAGRRHGLAEVHLR